MISEAFSNKKFKEANSFQLSPDSVSPKQRIGPLKKFEVAIFTQALRFSDMRRIDLRLWKRKYSNEKTFRGAIKMPKTTEVFKSTKKIQKVCLNIYGDKFPSSRLQSIFETLKRFNALRSLCLSFEGCMQINDENMNVLSKGLKGFKFLKEILLNLKHCSWLTNVGLQSFSKFLKTCTLLQRIDLSFQSCGGISNSGLCCLSKGFERLISLQNATLKFFSCSAIKNEGFQALMKGLGRLELLKHINLDFDYCDGITDKGLESLYEIINKLPCLEEAILQLERSKRISSEEELRNKEKLEKDLSLRNIGMFCLSGLSHIIFAQKRGS